MTESWYRESFGAEYLTLYAHRDAAEARANVRAVVELAELSLDDRILDLACGAGRHLSALRAEGFLRVVGLDLSPVLLSEAACVSQGTMPQGVPLIRADMLHIPFAQAFDAVLSLFTSFGYFPRDDKDARVLAEISQVLRPGGVLVLDVMNRPRVVSHLVPCDSDQRGELRITNCRCLSEDSKRVIKDTEVRYPDGSIRRFRESVRLYTRDELIALLHRAGFAKVRAFGTLDGDSYTFDSPRLVLLALRGGAS
jgi:SAM-dependent methyltransferase